MFEPFIVFGGLLFWLISAALFLVAVAFVSFNRTGRAFLTVAGYVALIVLFSNADPLGWLKANWLNVIYGAGAYLAIGTLYMLVRWRVFLIPQVSAIYGEIREDFVKRNNIQGEIVDQTHRDQLARDVSYDDRLSKLGVKVPLRVRDNKAKLSGWLTAWPFSAAAFVLGDLLIQLVDGIVRMFSGMMQRMVDKEFSKYSELN